MGPAQAGGGTEAKLTVTLWCDKDSGRGVYKLQRRMGGRETGLGNWGLVKGAPGRTAAWRTGLGLVLSELSRSYHRDLCYRVSEDSLTAGKGIGEW